MTVFTLGLNHTTAPLDLRGRLAFAPDQIRHLLQGFRDRIAQQGEVAIVSTCNRTELYVGTAQGDATPLIHPSLHWLAEYGGVESGTLEHHSYVRQGKDAARHAFRVASGLDSMVLGEPQILGQMKQAVREADAAGTLGTTLHQLFQRSFAVAKDVRTNTEIGTHSISMAAASLRLATQLFGDLTPLRVLFVGAGEMIELVATHFAAKSPKAMVVANRSIDRGEKLATRLGAQAIRLVDLPDRLAEFDIVVSCTASSLPIISRSAVEKALKARKRKPIFMVDLAVPRDIEPEVADLSDVYLYTVDDLSARVQTAGEKRRAAVVQAEAIIETGVQGFAHWLDQRHTVPLIQALNQQADEWRKLELSRARKRLAQGQDPDAVMDALSQAITRKLLHGAMAELNAVSDENRRELGQTISRLFLRSAGTDPQ